MGNPLENGRAGYRKVVQNDEEYGRNLPGYYHTLGPQRIREVFPDHGLSEEIKHYRARHALSQSGDSPLAHPKVGISNQVSRWNETLGVAPEDLDQTLLSVLADAGLDIALTHGAGIFIPDAYPVLS